MSDLKALSSLCSLSKAHCPIKNLKIKPGDVHP